MELSPSPACQWLGRLGRDRVTPIIRLTTSHRGMTAFAVDSDSRPVTLAGLEPPGKPCSRLGHPSRSALAAISHGGRPAAAGIASVPSWPLEAPASRAARPAQALPAQHPPQRHPRSPRPAAVGDDGDVSIATGPCRLSCRRRGDGMVAAGDGQP